MACCTGCSAGALGSFFCAAYHAGNPSSVVIHLAATVETGVRQERVSTPLTKTEHDPHCPRPQPNLGPCRFSSFDSTYNSGVSGAAITVCTLSFTRMLNVFAISNTPPCV